MGFSFCISHAILPTSQLSVHTMHIATPDNEIELHDDFGVIVVETDYDCMTLVNGEWWYMDDNTGELLGKVEVH